MSNLEGVYLQNATLRSDLKKVRKEIESLRQKLKDAEECERVWADRYYQIFINAKGQQKRILWPESVWPILQKWAEEVNDKYREDKQ